jgi:hypothetical protein
MSYQYGNTFLRLSQRKQLPSICAVYFVLHKDEVIYIGKSNARFAALVS